MKFLAVCMFALVATTMAGAPKKEKRGLLGLSDGLDGLHAKGIHGLHAPLDTGYSSYAANYPAPLLSADPVLSHFQPPVSFYAAPASLLSAAPAISHLPAVSSYSHSALPALSHVQPAAYSYASSAPLLSAAPAISYLPAISSYSHSALPAFSHNQPALPAFSHNQPALPALSHVQPALSTYAAPAPLLSATPTIGHLPAVSSNSHSVQRFGPAPIQHYSTVPLALDSYHHARAIVKSYAPSQW